ncbi:LysR family transcriptional regulator [Zavarzinella formosa]|uniref:LysR family transcriptional regulator n=1 Tax=Zavarzinella formosa TaxID=360055 RepID=UPI0002DFE105|nr:LysR family transcriptional regulator [Zavarzinella formosa]
MPRPSRLSIELLETFIAVLDADGDASEAAKVLDINQPSMSKRLALLQKAGQHLPQPWLARQGKTWRATAEGERVMAAAREMVRRNDQFQTLIATGGTDVPDVSLACGQEAVKDFVMEAVRKFRQKFPRSRIRIATPGGRERVLGVATGVYDLAIITHEPRADITEEEQLSEKLEQGSRRPLNVEPLFDDRFVLAATGKPGREEAKSAWHRRFAQSPEEETFSGSLLVGLPLILPEPGRGRRDQFDRWARSAKADPLDVALEFGGWEAMLHYAAAGLGVAFATERSTARFVKTQGPLLIRRLSPSEFPPDAVRLVTRKAHGAERPELSPPATALREFLLEAVKTA